MDKDVLIFLKDLADNNNREWFGENKGRYEAARKEVISLTETLIKRIGEFDEEVRYLEAKECMFRIYRDVRFSPDKSPYKRHFGTYIAKNGGHRSDYSGYYIHLEPGNCMVSGGIWCPDSEGVKRMREVIDVEQEELREILEEKEFVKYFGGKMMGIEPPLKRMPRGYSEDNPAAEWLKLRQFIVCHKFGDEMVEREDFVEYLVGVCRAMRRFSYWCNRAYFN